MTAVTHDSISLCGTGVVNIIQPKKGARFTLDSLLLADFCRIKPRDRILELGAGTGVISLLLAKKSPKARFVADELEPRAYGLLCRNIELNGLRDRIAPLDRNVNDLGRSLARDTFDVLIANPPYTKSGTGRRSPSPERQTARQDQSASLHAWLDCRDLLKNKGRYFLVFPAGRAVELISLLSEKKLEPKRVRFVHPHHHKPASLVLIEAVKAAGTGIDVLPPLVVHGVDGGYSDEIKKIYGLDSASTGRSVTSPLNGAEPPAAAVRRMHS
jgi:tRNA1Val (adenine37-N6)-methyltransferase